MRQFRRLFDEAEHLYACLDRPRRALQRIERALRLKPDDPDALVLKGRILFRLDRVRESWNCYGRALALDRGCSQAYLGRASILYGLVEDNKRALQEVSKALRYAGRDRWERFEALRLRGHVLSALDREREALRYYRAALKLRPKDPEILWNLGQSLLLENKPKRALRYLEKALRILNDQEHPDKVDLGLVIGSKTEALNALGKHTEALKIVEDGIKHVRTTPLIEELRNLRDQTRVVLYNRSSAVGRRTRQ